MIHNPESLLMLSYLQISFPLPKAYNSIPSKCGMLYVLFWYHLDWAERSLHCELALERGGKKQHPISLSQKKHWNVAGILLQWWFKALVPGRGFRWRLVQHWWQKANMHEGHRGVVIIYCVRGETVCGCKLCQFIKRLKIKIKNSCLWCILQKL